MIENGGLRVELWPFEVFNFPLDFQCVLKFRKYVIVMIYIYMLYVVYGIYGIPKGGGNVKPSPTPINVGLVAIPAEPRQNRNEPARGYNGGIMPPPPLLKTSRNAEIGTRKIWGLAFGTHCLPEKG